MTKAMSRKYWTDDELCALRHGFWLNVSMDWSKAVEVAANAGSTRMVKVTPEQWDHIAAIVGTRDADQCAKRLQTERRQEQERRRSICEATSAAHQGVAVRGVPDEEESANASTRIVNGCNVSPYLGQASGRIVLSFNGRGAA